jgi:hypothetical protein
MNELERQSRTAPAGRPKSLGLVRRKISDAVQQHAHRAAIVLVVLQDALLELWGSVRTPSVEPCNRAGA